MVGNNAIVLFSIGEHRDFVEYFFCFIYFDTKHWYDRIRCFLCLSVLIHRLSYFSE